jgi:histone H3/H4
VFFEIKTKNLVYLLYKIMDRKPAGPKTPAKKPATVAPGAPKKTVVKPNVNAIKPVGYGGVKHKKILKDNIQGITNGAIQRLANKGGIKSLSALSYEEVRGYLKNYMEKVIRNAITFTEHDRRRSVMEKDVRNSLKSLGRTAVFGDGRQVMRKSGDGTKRPVKLHSKPPTTVCVGYQGTRRTYHGPHPNAKIQKKFHIGGGNPAQDAASDDIDPNEVNAPYYDNHASQQYIPYNQNDDQFNANNLDDDNEAPYDPVPPQSDEEDEDDEEYEIENDDEDDSAIRADGENQLGGAKKPYKFHPGTVALRRIRYYQKQAGHCFNISKVCFRRLVREIAQDFKNDLRFTLDAMIIFQLDAEHYIVRLCEDAILCTIHRGAVRTLPKDFQLARRLRNDTLSSN